MPEREENETGREDIFISDSGKKYLFKAKIQTKGTLKELVCDIPEIRTWEVIVINYHSSNFKKNNESIYIYLERHKKNCR